MFFGEKFSQKKEKLRKIKTFSYLLGEEDMMKSNVKRPNINIMRIPLKPETKRRIKVQNDELFCLPRMERLFKPLVLAPRPANLKIVPTLFFKSWPRFVKLTN